MSSKGKRSRRRNKHKRQIGRLVGGWKLVELLGQGGNGEVWEATKDGEKNCAIKLLKSIDEVSYKRFLAETHIISTTPVEGIIKLVESNLPEDPKTETPWFSMPIAEDFNKFIVDMPPLEVAEHFIYLAESLSHLHDRDICHRDIKPANILALEGRLRFSDFGLVKYPNKEDITPKRRDVGAKFTMAPEMRRHASEANGKQADVYSLAKTLWIALSGEQKGFDGQYSSSSVLSIKHYCEDIYTTSLENLFIECTDNAPQNRPTARQFSSRLKEWIKLSTNFHSRNLTEWLELQNSIFPTGEPTHASWVNIDSICAVLNEVCSSKSLNHMFYPTGGGNTLIGVSKAEENGMIALHICEKSAEIMNPKKLTYESFDADPQWNYFRLELENIDPSGVEKSLNQECTREALMEISPGEYVEYHHWDYNEYNGEPLPDFARPIDRFLSGSFVFFGTRSFYNRESSTYDARHNKMTEDEFREYIRRNVENHAKDNNS